MKTNVLQAKKALLVLFAMLMPMLASAHDFELGGIYYNVLSSANLTVEVTYKGDYVSYNDDRYKGTVVIPETVTYNGNTYQVIWIGENAFYGCRNLSSVTMPNSVVGIDDSALSGCESLTFVSISENTTSIGYYAFSHCSNLSSITIPEATISIAEGAFWGCTSLTNLKIPQRVENIGKYSFGSCESLTTIVVDEGNNVYDSRNGCNAIIETESNTLIVGCKNSVIPNTVTAIGDMAFRMHPLNQITIPKQIKSIGNEAFTYCGATSLKVEEGNSWYDSRNGCNAIIETESNTLIVGCKNSVIPNTVTAIGDYAFAGTDLWSISLPNGLKKIGESAFEGCGNLTSITIPEGVTSIESRAFSGCSSLTSITIPEGVTFIGQYAFHTCRSLSTIDVPTSVIEIGRNAFWGTPWYNNKPDGITYINNVLYEYKGEMPANTSIEVKDGVVSITPYAFYNRSNLVSITLPESVDKIGEWAFACCSGLSSIALPQEMTSIGESAFAACSSLTSIIVPEGITTIEFQMFHSCGNLASVTLPESLTSIGNNTFVNCRSLTSIVIPDGVTSIGDNAFYNCDRLASIVIPDNVVRIGESAFCYCTGLTSVSTQESCKLEDIGDYAFSDCYKLASINIPENSKLTSIGKGAFVSCSFSSINIPASVTTIGDVIFSGCNNLTSIVVAEGNTVYDSRNGCNAIIETGTNTLVEGCSTTIIPDDVTSIGDYAFFYRGSLTSITIPESVTSIGEYAVYNCTKLTSITCKATTPPSISAYTFYKVDKSIPVYVSSTSLSDYQTAEGWKDFTNFIGMDTRINNPELKHGDSEAIIYDLNGRRITNTENLPSGVYIQNGKKIVVM